jgi:hypothetical protein
MSVTRILAIGAFILAGLMFVAVEWLARRENSRIPSLGAVTGFVMRHRSGRIPVGRIAMYGFWWWVGWHFFAR